MAGISGGVKGEEKSVVGHFKCQCQKYFLVVCIFFQAQLEYISNFRIWYGPAVLLQSIWCMLTTLTICSLTMAYAQCDTDTSQGLVHIPVTSLELQSV